MLDPLDTGALSLHSEQNDEVGTVEVFVFHKDVEWDDKHLTEYNLAK